MISISNLRDKIAEDVVKERKHYDQAQKERYYHLIHCKEAGRGLLELKAIFDRHCTRKGIETDLGVFTSWTNFLESEGINRKTANKYIYLAQNWDLAVRMGCLENKHRFRINFTIEAIEWALERLEDDPNFEPTVEKFQQERRTGKKQSNTNKPSYRELEKKVEYLSGIADQESGSEETVSKQVYEEVKEERDSLRERVSTLEAEVSHLKAQLNRRTGRITKTKAS